MRRTILMLLASAPLLSGQFHSLAATDDGGVLYFSTSLRVRGTDQKTWEKIFRWDGARLSLYQERERVSQPLTWLTNQYRLPGVSVSGDGATVVLISKADCSMSGSTCFEGLPKYRTEIGDAQSSRMLLGQGRLSRNRRYMATCCDGSAWSSPTLYDFETGANQRISFTGGTPPVVSSSGKVVTPWLGGLSVQDLDGSRTVSTAATATQAVIADSGATAFYTDGRIIARVDLATGSENVIYRGTAISLVGISSSGDRVAFLAVGQLLVVGASGTGLRLVSHEPGGIAEAALAGNGAVAYAVSRAGRILRFNLGDGSTTVVVGRTLTVTQTFSSRPYPVAGSAYCLNGSGLSDETLTGAAPLPVEMGGLKLLLDGTAVPLLKAFPDQACFQVPWGTAAASHTLVASAPSESEFEPVVSTPLDVRGMFAQFVRTGADFLSPPLVAHQGFRGLVTADSPARPGETLHFYMTGLGPVSPAVADGAAGPSTPPASAVTAPACRLTALYQSGGNPVQASFAGLAPGLVGYYQVSIRLPEILPAIQGQVMLYCSSGADYQGDTVLIPVWPRGRGPA